MSSKFKIFFFFLIVVLSQAGGWASVYAFDTLITATVSNDAFGAVTISPTQWGGGNVDHIYLYRGDYPDTSTQVQLTCTSGCNQIIFDGTNYFMSAASVDGNYWVVFSNVSSQTFYFKAVRSGGIWAVIPNPSATRIISTFPDNLATVATTTLTGASIATSIVGYVNATDWATSTTVLASYRNPTCTDVSGFAVQAVNSECSFQATYTISSSGDFTAGTTTVFNQLGRWNFTVKLQNANNSWCLFGFCLLHNSVDLATRSGYFVIGAPTSYDNFQDSVRVAGAYASTTSLTSCNPIAFSVSDCVVALFIPNQQQINDFFSTTTLEFSRRFPLGYITDAVSILSTTTVGTLTPIDATIPGVLPGHGAHIRLDITGSLDSLYSATTSIYTNSSAPSSETFYQITYRYWSYVVYVGLAFYLIRRVLGSHLIPDSLHREEDYVVHRGGLGDRDHRQDTYFRRKKK